MLERIGLTLSQRPHPESYIPEQNNTIIMQTFAGLTRWIPKPAHYTEIHKSFKNGNIHGIPVMTFFRLFHVFDQRRSIIHSE